MKILPIVLVFAGLVVSCSKNVPKYENKKGSLSGSLVAQQHSLAQYNGQENFMTLKKFVSAYNCFSWEVIPYRHFESSLEDREFDRILIGKPNDRSDSRFYYAFVRDFSSRGPVVVQTRDGSKMYRRHNSGILSFE